MTIPTPDTFVDGTSNNVGVVNAQDVNVNQTGFTGHLQSAGTKLQPVLAVIDSLAISELPDYDSNNNGEVLKVNAQGNLEWDTDNSAAFDGNLTGNLSQTGNRITLGRGTTSQTVYYIDFANGYRDSDNNLQTGQLVYSATQGGELSIRNRDGLTHLLHGRSEASAYPTAISDRWLPATVGSNGQVLKVDSSGNVVWADAPTPASSWDDLTDVSDISSGAPGQLVVINDGGDTLVFEDPPRFQLSRALTEFESNLSHTHTNSVSEDYASGYTRALQLNIPARTSRAGTFEPGSDLDNNGDGTNDVTYNGTFGNINGLSDSANDLNNSIIIIEFGLGVGVANSNFLEYERSDDSSGNQFIRLDGSSKLSIQKPGTGASNATGDIQKVALSPLAGQTTPVDATPATGDILALAIEYLPNNAIRFIPMYYTAATGSINGGNDIDFVDAADEFGLNQIHIENLNIANSTRNVIKRLAWIQHTGYERHDLLRSLLEHGRDSAFFGAKTYNTSSTSTQSYSSDFEFEDELKVPVKATVGTLQVGSTELTQAKLDELLTALHIPEERILKTLTTTNTDMVAGDVDKFVQLDVATALNNANRRYTLKTNIGEVGDVVFLLNASHGTRANIDVYSENWSSGVVRVLAENETIPFVKVRTGQIQLWVPIVNFLTAQSGGLAQSQVDARITTLVEQFARDTTTRLGKGKLPTDTVYDADISDFQTQSQVDARIALPAREGNTDRWAKAKLPIDVAYDADFTGKLFPTEVQAYTPSANQAMVANDIGKYVALAPTADIRYTFNASLGSNGQMVWLSNQTGTAGVDISVYGGVRDLHLLRVLKQGETAPFLKINNVWVSAVDYDVGLSQSEVDTRVTTLVPAVARDSSSRWTKTKLPTDTVYDDDLAGKANSSDVAILNSDLTGNGSKFIQVNGAGDDIVFVNAPTGGTGTVKYENVINASASANNNFQVVGNMNDDYFSDITDFRNDLRYRIRFIPQAFADRTNSGVWTGTGAELLAALQTRSIGTNSVAADLTLTNEGATRNYRLAKTSHNDLLLDNQSVLGSLYIDEETVVSYSYDLEDMPGENERGTGQYLYFNGSEYITRDIPHIGEILWNTEETGSVAAITDRLWHSTGIDYINDNNRPVIDTIFAPDNVYRLSYTLTGSTEPKYERILMGSQLDLPVSEPDTTDSVSALNRRYRIHLPNIENVAIEGAGSVYITVGDSGSDRVILIGDELGDLGAGTFLIQTEHVVEHTYDLMDMPSQADMAAGKAGQVIALNTAKNGYELVDQTGGGGGGGPLDLEDVDITIDQDTRTVTSRVSGSTGITTAITNIDVTGLDTNITVNFLGGGGFGTVSENSFRLASVSNTVAFATLDNQNSQTISFFKIDANTLGVSVGTFTEFISYTFSRSTTTRHYSITDTTLIDYRTPSTDMADVIYDVQYLLGGIVQCAVRFDADQYRALTSVVENTAFSRLTAANSIRVNFYTEGDAVTRQRTFAITRLAGVGQNPMDEMMITDSDYLASRDGDPEIKLRRVVGGGGSGGSTDAAGLLALIDNTEGNVDAAASTGDATKIKLTAESLGATHSYSLPQDAVLSANLMNRILNVSSTSDSANLTRLLTLSSSVGQQGDEVILRNSGITGSSATYTLSVAAKDFTNSNESTLLAEGQWAHFIHTGRAWHKINDSLGLSEGDAFASTDTTTNVVSDADKVPFFKANGTRTNMTFSNFATHVQEANHSLKTIFTASAAANARYIDSGWNPVINHEKHYHITYTPSASGQSANGGFWDGTGKELMDALTTRAVNDLTQVADLTLRNLGATRNYRLAITTAGDLLIGNQNRAGTLKIEVEEEVTRPGDLLGNFRRARTVTDRNTSSAANVPATWVNNLNKLTENGTFTLTVPDTIGNNGDTMGFWNYGTGTKTVASARSGVGNFDANNRGYISWLIKDNGEWRRPIASDSMHGAWPVFTANSIDILGSNVTVPDWSQYGELLDITILDRPGSQQMRPNNYAVDDLFSEDLVAGNTNRIIRFGGNDSGTWNRVSRTFGHGQIFSVRVMF